MPSIRGSLEYSQIKVAVHIAPIIDSADVGVFGGRTYTGLIYTGATRTCVTQTVIAQTGLRQAGRLLVASPTSLERRRVYGLQLGFYCSADDDASMSNTLYMLPFEFSGPDFINNSDFDVLIGMDVISRGRLIVDGNTYEFRF